MASVPSHYKSHVAVFSFPIGTHAAPLLALVRMLAAASPQVRFSFFNTEQGNARISSRDVVENVTNIKVYDMWDGVPEGHNYSDDFIGESVAFFLKAVPENIRKGVLLAEAAESGLKVGCLFTDSWFWFAADMADEMCVPWMGYWAAGALPLATHVNNDLILAIIHETAGKQMAQECPFHQIPGMSTIRICDVPKLLLEHRDTILGNLHHQMALKLPKAAAVVLNSFEELDTVVTQDLKSKLQTNVLSIGPLPLIINQEKAPPQSSSNNECMVWLDKHKTASVAYISFGTLMKCEPDELVACAEALEATQVPYLWSLPQSEMHILPEGFLERTKTSSGSGKMVTWAPQLDVLNHPSVGAHVTHCGWNSMLESIAGGVPIIGRPFLGEHFVTIRLVEEVWKFGVRVDGGVFTKSGLMKALEVVLLSEDGKKLRDNICGLREEAVKAVGLNGSSALNFNILKQIITSAN